MLTQEQKRLAEMWAYRNFSHSYQNDDLKFEWYDREQQFYVERYEQDYNWDVTFSYSDILKLI